MGGFLHVQRLSVSLLPFWRCTLPLAWLPCTGGCAGPCASSVAPCGGVGSQGWLCSSSTHSSIPSVSSTPSQSARLWKIVWCSASVASLAPSTFSPLFELCG